MGLALPKLPNGLDNLIHLGQLGALKLQAQNNLDLGKLQDKLVDVRLDAMISFWNSLG